MNCNCESLKCSVCQGNGCSLLAGKQVAMYVGALCDGCAQQTPKEYMKPDLNTLPEQVSNFVQALIFNAMEVEGWNVNDMEGGSCFADTIPHVKVNEDDSITICDNYDGRLFEIIYTYHSEDVWTVRRMYSDIPFDDTYSYAKCMADASIMFTG
jgi:hypothetical protein